jgi:hypothetical protein
MVSTLAATIDVATMQGISASAPSTFQTTVALTSETAVLSPSDRVMAAVGLSDCHLMTSWAGLRRYFGIPFSDDMGGNYWQGSYHGDDSCTPLPVFNNSGVGNYTIQEQPACFDTLSERYAQFGEEFVARSAATADPFFLYMAFSHVHTAIPADPQWAGTSFWNTSLRGPFGDAAAEMDWVVGRVMQSLVDAGVDDNTVIMFSSDNGPWRIKQLDGGSYGVFQGAYAWMNDGYTDTGKASTWEGGVRMPGFVRYSGVIPPNSVSTSVHSNMDFFPTMLSLASIAPPAGVLLDGIDMSDTILGTGDAGHSYLPIYRNAALFAMRFGSYKAHWATKSGYGNDPVVYHVPPLLFNVDVDPSEMYPIDIKSVPALWTQLNASVAHHFASLTVGTNLLPFNNVTFQVCCDPAKACKCTDPYTADTELAQAVKDASSAHRIGTPWWSHDEGSDW